MLRLCFDFIFQTDHRKETRPPIISEEYVPYEQKTASKEVHSFIIILLITIIQ